MESTLLCVQIVLFHSTKHFNYPNTPWSQCVWISDFLLYQTPARKSQSPVYHHVDPNIINVFNQTFIIIHAISTQACHPRTESLNGFNSIQWL